MEELVEEKTYQYMEEKKKADLLLYSMMPRFAITILLQFNNKERSQELAYCKQRHREDLPHSATKRFKSSPSGSPSKTCTAYYDTSNNTVIQYRCHITKLDFLKHVFTISRKHSSNISAILRTACTTASDLNGTLLSLPDSDFRCNFAAMFSNLCISFVAMTTYTDANIALV